MPKAVRSRGTVKWFNDAKGYGFIRPNDGSKDLFVHFKNVINTQGHVTLQEGEEVEYERVDDPKGPRAENVSRV